MNVYQQFSLSANCEYVTPVDLDLYNAPNCQELATQAAAGRHLRLLSPTSAMPEAKSIPIQLCEDDYISWLPVNKLPELTLASTPYQAVNLSRSQIEAKIPAIIAFTETAMKIPNYYLWGGTIGPNYDCSGLMQAAFASVGIWIPRDSYQQEEFTETIPKYLLQPGDLIFFGQQKVNHVALYLGEDYYIHSSGKDRGRNGIGIDQLSADGNEVSLAYYQDLWGYGRVIKNYYPQPLNGNFSSC